MMGTTVITPKLIDQPAHLQPSPLSCNNRIQLLLLLLLLEGDRFPIYGIRITTDKSVASSFLLPIPTTLDDGLLDLIRVPGHA